MRRRYLSQHQSALLRYCRHGGSRRNKADLRARSQPEFAAFLFAQCSNLATLLAAT